MTPPCCSEEIAELLPFGDLGRLEIVEGAGHGTFRDRPEETEAILREFLASEAVAARASLNSAPGRTTALHEHVAPATGGVRSRRPVRTRRHPGPQWGRRSSRRGTTPAWPSRSS